MLVGWRSFAAHALFCRLGVCQSLIMYALDKIAALAVCANPQRLWYDMLSVQVSFAVAIYTFLLGLDKMRIFSRHLWLGLDPVFDFPEGLLCKAVVLAFCSFAVGYIKRSPRNNLIILMKNEILNCLHVSIRHNDQVGGAEALLIAPRRANTLRGPNRCGYTRRKYGNQCSICTNALGILVI